MELKAILFDLDGTLVDSEYFHYQCWNEILIESSVSLTYDEWLDNHAGIPLDKNAATLSCRYGLTTPIKQLIERREQLSLDRLATEEVALMYHAKEILEFLKEKNVKLALVTGSPRKDVDALFSKNGLGEYFHVQVTSTDVSKNKPNPESYNLCCSTLGVEKAACLAFEDTLNGVKAAKAAGLTCFAIQRHEKQHDQLRIADRLFTDFEQAKAYLISEQLV